MLNEVRLNSIEIEVARLRLEVRNLARQLEQVESERDAFILELRQQFSRMHETIEVATAER